MANKKKVKQTPPASRRSKRLRTTPQGQSLAAHFATGEVISVISDGGDESDSNSNDTPSSIPSAHSTATVIASLAKVKGSAVSRELGPLGKTASGKGKQRALPASRKPQRRLESTESESDSEFDTAPTTQSQFSDTLTSDTDSDDDLEPPRRSTPKKNKAAPKKPPAASAQSPPAPKRRGRPPGKKNTPTPQPTKSKPKRPASPAPSSDIEEPAATPAPKAKRADPAVKAPRRRGVKWLDSEVEYITTMIKTHGGQWTWIASEGVASGKLYRGRNGHDVQDKWKILRRKGEEIPEEAVQVAATRRRPIMPWSAEDTAFLVEMRKKHANRFVLMLLEGQKDGYFADRDARQLKEKVRNLEKAQAKKAAIEHPPPAEDVSAPPPNATAIEVQVAVDIAAIAHMDADGPAPADDETEMPPTESADDEAPATPATLHDDHIDHGVHSDEIVPESMEESAEALDDHTGTRSVAASRAQDNDEDVDEPPAKRQRVDDSPASQPALPQEMLHMMDGEGGPQTQAFESESLPPMFESQQPATQAPDDLDEDDDALHTPVQPPREVVPSTYLMKQSKNHRRLSGEQPHHHPTHAIGPLEIDAEPLPDAAPAASAVVTAPTELEQRSVQFTLHLVQRDQKAQVGPKLIEMKYGQTFQELQEHVLATMVPDRPPTTELHFAFDSYSLPQRHEIVGDWIQDRDDIHATIG